MNNLNTEKRGSLFLIGGGEEARHSWSDAVFQKLIKLISGGTIAILAYEDDHNRLANYLQDLGAHSATTFIFKNRDLANHVPTCARLMEFDALFIEGGHQQIYLNAWKGTLLEQRITEFYFSGKVLAATSAGAMLLGEITFISKTGRVHPEVLFQNPFLQSISLETDFLNLLPNTMIDTHFSERGRLVRLLPLLARAFLQKNRRVIGVGIDEETALCIGPDLVAEVVGAKTATFLVPTVGSKIRFQFPKPPVYTDLTFHRLGAGRKFDFIQHQVINSEKITGESHPAVSKFKNYLIFLGAKSLNENQSNNLPPFDAFNGQKGARLTVLASQQAHALAHEFAKVLRANGHSRIAVLPLSDNKQESLVQAPEVRQSEGIVLAGNNIGEMLSFLRSTTPVAKIFRTRLKTGVLLAFLSEAIKLAGRWAIVTNSSQTGVKLIEGLNLIKNSIIIPTLLDQPEQVPQILELTYAALFEKSMVLGILMDSQNQFILNPTKTIEFFGDTGTFVIDISSAEREMTHSQLLTWTNARLHLLHAEYGFDLAKFEVTG
jgi:cyanophycinase